MGGALPYPGKNPGNREHGNGKGHSSPSEESSNGNASVRVQHQGQCLNACAYVWRLKKSPEQFGMVLLRVILDVLPGNAGEDHMNIRNGIKRAAGEVGQGG